MPITRNTDNYLVVELRKAVEANIEGVTLTNASSEVLAHATLHHMTPDRPNGALHFKKEGGQTFPLGCRCEDVCNLHV